MTEKTKLALHEIVDLAGFVYSAAEHWGINHFRALKPCGKIFHNEAKTRNQLSRTKTDPTDAAKVAALNEGLALLGRASSACLAHAIRITPERGYWN